MSADSAYLKVEKALPANPIGFRDASLGQPTYLLHLHDVLRGVEKVTFINDLIVMTKRFLG